MLGLVVACTGTVDAQSAEHTTEATVQPVTATTHQSSAALPGPDTIAQLPPDGGPEFNRLIFETSPYLRQHARNPVDWYTWGEEAFAKARAENKPVFLSIGYSSCHWCHVMAHESFEDPETAALMNEHFISIKVDREERPDVDDIYMKAIQMIAGRGGWPMSVWLLPDGRPYFGGTYFPREDTGRGAGFKTMLVTLANAYHEQHADVDEQANRIAQGIRQQLGAAQADPVGPLDRGVMDAAITAVTGEFDSSRGGFSGAPKFPPHMSLDLLLYEYERTGRAELESPIRVTLDAMMLGGVHDHVGGGFHRYSTDAVWLVPHFEKMLYDNGQLARAYATAYRVFGDERYRAAAEGICDWMLREMTDDRGGFWSALDADSEGEEGKFYVWTREEVLRVLGEEEGDLFCHVYNITAGGNWHEESTGKQLDTNIPHLRASLDTVAQELSLEPAALHRRMATARDTLREVRNRRIWPGLDDKVLASWNGLAIAGLASTGKATGNAAYLAAAARAADFVLTTMRRDGRLLRSYNHGQAKLNAYLDDYAFLAFGLLELHDATGDERWLTEARGLVDVLFAHHWDDTDGGFYFTSDDHEDLLARKKDCIDGAVPSGNGVAARVLVRLATLTGDARYRDAARQLFDVYVGWMQRIPRAAESTILAVAEAYDAGLLGADAVAPMAAEPDAAWDAAQVRVTGYASRVVVNPGDRLRVAVQLAVADGWHVNSHAPLQDYLIPTSLSLEGDGPLVGGEVTYPTGTTLSLEFSADPLSVYDGTVTLTMPVTVSDQAEAGAETVVLAVRVQACDDHQCLRPETGTLKIPITVVLTPAPDETRHAHIFDSI